MHKGTTWNRGIAAFVISVTAIIGLAGSASAGACGKPNSCGAAYDAPPGAAIQRVIVYPGGDYLFDQGHESDSNRVTIVVTGTNAGKIVTASGSTIRIVGYAINGADTALARSVAQLWVPMMPVNGQLPTLTFDYYVLRPAKKK